MINRILEIVVYLIDFFRDNHDHFLNIDDLSISLKAKGYTDTEISSAYSWLLERYENAPEKHFSNFPKIPVSNRVLTEAERFHLSIESQGFLLKLLSMSLIDNEQFELIIERCTMISSLPASVDHVKLIASTVIFEEVDEIDRISIFDTDYDSSTFMN